MTKNVSLDLVNHVGMFASKLVIDVILPHAKVMFIKLVVFMTCQLISKSDKGFYFKLSSTVYSGLPSHTILV